MDQKAKRGTQGLGNTVEPSLEAVAFASAVPLELTESCDHGPTPDGYELYLLKQAKEIPMAFTDTEVYLAWNGDSAEAMC